MKVQTRRLALAALTAALALPARAQTGATPPAPAPAPPAAPAPAGAHDVKAVLDMVHDWSVRSVEFAKAAASKASSPKLKALANRIVQENGKIEQETQQIAKERGVTLIPAAQIIASPAVQSGMSQVNSATGAQADDIFASSLASDRSTMVSQLKTFRDQTPGSDARLKKWLDDVENTAEAQSNDAYAARHEVKQRQGRTPAK